MAVLPQEQEDIVSIYSPIDCEEALHPMSRECQDPGEDTPSAEVDVLAREKREKDVSKKQNERLFCSLAQEPCGVKVSVLFSTQKVTPHTHRCTDAQMYFSFAS